MKRFLANLFGRPGMSTQHKRPRRSSRPAVEQLEARDMPVVGAFELPPEVLPGDGLDGVVKVVTDDGYGSGTLLAGGRHILTAAHVVTDDSGNVVSPYADVVFHLPSGPETLRVPAANFRIHPGWEGDSDIVIPDHDLAILELPSLAPFEAERRTIYRSSNEVGQEFQLVGYGRTGTGEHGERSGTGGVKRHGFNVYDTVDDNKLEFLFTEDPDVSFIAHGDSGGPDLLNGQIAGVHSYVRESFLGGEPESSFGERAFSVRVSAYADWIDGVTTSSHPLVLDMNLQPDGSNGTRDTIDVRVTYGILEISVNGSLYHSEPVANVTSLTITGSNDSEDFVISGPLGTNVSIDPRLGLQFPAQSLTVFGTDGPDSVTVGTSTVTFGGHTIAFGGVELTVNTRAGDDVIAYDSPITFVSATAAPIQLSGGPGNDTLIGPNISTLWSLWGVNAGTLNSLVNFGGMENLTGGSADDTFRFGYQSSISGTVNGGGGGNTLDYTGALFPVTVNLQSGAATATGGFSAINSVLGNGYSTLIGRNLPTTWTLTALNAGQLGGSGQAALSFSGFKNLDGGTAPDTFKFLNAGSISGTLSGNSSFTFLPGVLNVDTLDYSARSTGVVVDLGRDVIPGAAGASGIERVVGTMKDDLLRGDTRANILEGGGGSDILVGGDGNDQLLAGNTGRSILIGGRGRDTLVGGNPLVEPLTGRRISDGSDLLIGGRTSFDDDDQALTAIMAEWRSNRTYAQRVQTLRAGVPVGAGLAALTTATVFDDGEADQMAGLGGDDWFWGVAVEATDRTKLEFLN